MGLFRSGLWHTRTHTVYFRCFASEPGLDSVRQLHVGNATVVDVEKMLHKMEAQIVYEDLRNPRYSIYCQQCDCEKLRRLGVFEQVAELSFLGLESPSIGSDDMEIALELAEEADEDLRKKYDLEQGTVDTFRQKLKQLDSDSD